MSLSDHEKSELAGQFALLAELNEPEALLMAVARVAAKASKGLGVQGRNLSEDELKRWRIVANALFDVEAAVNAAQSPEALKPKAHMTEWPPAGLRPATLQASAQQTAETSPTGAPPQPEAHKAES